MKRKIERSKIQLLYDACCGAFLHTDRSPSSNDIQLIRTILDTIEAIDVGIDDSEETEKNGFSCMRIKKTQRRKKLIYGHRVSQITYIHIDECDEFSIGVFCFPAGAKLPLHDHPNMTVLSKLLYGSVYSKSYDWVKKSESKCKTGGLAAKVIDGVKKAPSPATVLFPATGGNIHSFTALTPCAILDVLTPPYSDTHGRPSTYFTDIPIPSLCSKISPYAILQEIDIPDDLVVTGAPYLGPEIDRS